MPNLCQHTTQIFGQVRDWLNREASGRNLPLVVGIGGPGGSGKSTLTRWLLDHMRGVSELSLDDFRLSRNVRKQNGKYGSHPDGNDLRRLEAALEHLRAGGEVRQPVFDREKGEVIRTDVLPAGRIVLADGEIAAHKQLRPHFDRLILVEAHWRTQLNTRLTRDLRERGCGLEKAIHIFLESNLRDYPEFSTGAREEADILLYRNLRNRFRIQHLKPTAERNVRE